MGTEKSKTFEYRTFVLGVVVLGGAFGAVIFRNASELWASAPTWSLAASVVASLLLCLIPVLSYRPQSGVRIPAFLLSLAVTVGLIMWYDAAHDVPAPVDNAGVRGLLHAVQSASSWKHRLFVLVPTVLSMPAQWVCGAFLLSLRRLIAGQRNKSLNQSRALFASTTVGVAVLLAFTIGLFASEENGSIFVSLQYPEGISVEKRNIEIDHLRQELLQSFDAIESIDVFAGRIDVEYALASSIFDRQVLFEIKPGDRWQRGKSRQQLAHSLRAYEQRVVRVELSVLDAVSRPSVPMRESYTSTNLNFVPDSTVLEQLGIPEAALSEALATRLRLMPDFDSLQTLQGITVEGQYIELKRAGSFEVVRAEIPGSALAAAHWESLSPLIEAASQGIAIYLDENRINMFGIDLGKLETTILMQLRAEVSPVDIALLSRLPVAVRGEDRSNVLLGDVARIERARIENPQGEANGEPYKIQLRLPGM